MIAVILSAIGTIWLGFMIFAEIVDKIINHDKN